MSERVWVWDGEKVVPKSERERPKGPFCISDTMDGVRSMADGRYYDSKSRYRAELKARGLVELGNERLTPPPVRAPDFTPVFKETAGRLGYD